MTFLTLPCATSARASSRTSTDLPELRLEITHAEKGGTMRSASADTDSGASSNSSAIARTQRFAACPSLDEGRQGARRGRLQCAPPAAGGRFSYIV
jgi:hypothetical protein